MGYPTQNNKDDFPALPIPKRKQQPTVDDFPILKKKETGGVVSSPSQSLSESEGEINKFISMTTPTQRDKAQMVKEVNQVVSQKLPSKKDITTEAVTRLQHTSIFESLNDQNRMQGLSDANDDPIGTIVNKNEQEKNNIKDTQFTEGANVVDVHREIAIRDKQNDLLKNNFFQDGYQAQDYLAGKQINPNSLTHRVALKKVQEKQKIDNAFNTTTDFEKGAVKLYTDKENEFQNDIADSKKAQYVLNALSDPNVIARAQHDPEFAKEYHAEQFNFYNHYPAKAKEIVNTKIAQKLEDDGHVNWLYNNPGKEKVDKVVNEMIESGELNPQEANVYRNEREDLGTLKSLIFGSPIPTADVINSGSEAFQKAMGGIASSARDITNKVTFGSFQKLGLLESDEDRTKRLQGEQYSTPTVQPKGGHAVLSGISELTGSVAPMILGEMAGIPTMATATMQFEGQNADYARENIKGKGNQAMFTILATTLDAISMKLLPTKEAAKGVNSLLKEEVANVLRDLSDKKITEGIASDILGNKIKSFVGSIATSNTKSAAVMDALNFGHNGLKAAFGGRDFNLENEAKEAMKSYPSLWLNNTFLSALGAAGSKEKVVNGKIIRQLADDPYYSRFQIEEMAKKHPELAATKEQSLSNLEHAVKVQNELDSRTDLSEKQKNKYMMLSMKDKILGEKAKEIPDKSLRAETEKELIINEIEKDRILNPEMGSKKFIEEMYDNELLPKSDMRMLEDEKGKFSEYAVGGYLKYVAQQANNLGEDWTPHTTKAPDVSHIPEQVIEAANERWAKEIEAAKKEPEIVQKEEPQKSVSVIMPEENTHPNIIEPIKPTEEIGNTEEPPIEPPKGEVPTNPYIQYPPTSLNYMGTGKLETEFGVEARTETERKRDVYTIKEAEDLISNGLDVSKLSNDILSGSHTPSDAEFVAMTKYAAELADRLRGTDRTSPEYDKTLSELSKVATAANAAGREEGRALGVRARFKTVPDGSYGDFMLTESSVNNDAPLTDNQKQVANVDWDRLEAAQKDLAERESKLDEERKAFAAEQEVVKTKKSTPRTKKTHEDFVKEREDFMAHAREQLKKARGETSVTLVPYAKELFAIAPDVAKMVKSLAEEGIYKLAEVVKTIREQFKPDIPDLTEKDIRDIIAGEYSEKKITKREAAIRAQNLKLEAQAINKLEAALKNEPVAEKAKVKKNQVVAEIKKQLGLDKVEQLQSLKKRNEAETEKIKEKIKKGDFAPTEKKQSIYEDKEIQKKFPELYKSVLKSRDQLIKVKRDITVRRLRQLYENKSDNDKAIEVFSKALNVPRTLMASWDFSAPLRQGIVASIAHPSMATEALKFMFQASVNEKVYNRWLEDVHNSDLWELSQKIELAITDPESLHVKEAEEAFQGAPYAEKIPILGPGVKASERAYVGYLNHLRWNLFNMYVDRFMDLGKTFENDPKLYKGIASYINSATGRGGYGIAKLEEFSPVMNWFLFASKLIASRVNMLGLTDVPNIAVRAATLGHRGVDFGFYTKLPPELRVEAAKDMLKFLAVGSATIMMAKQIPGTQVESDPRSSDFGKIRHGNTRWDIWGGFQPYARVLTQVLMAERKTTTNGRIQELNGEGFMAQTRFTPLATFMRQKLAPVPGEALTLATGEDATGRKVTPLQILESNLPLVGQDIYQGVKDQGVKGLFTVGIPSAFGVGVQVYKPNTGNSKVESKSEGNKSKSSKKSFKKEE